MAFSMPVLRRAFAEIKNPSISFRKLETESVVLIDHYVYFTMVKNYASDFFGFLDFSASTFLTIFCSSIKKARTTLRTKRFELKLILTSTKLALQWKHILIHCFARLWYINVFWCADEPLSYAWMTTRSSICTGYRLLSLLCVLKSLWIHVLYLHS